MSETTTTVPAPAERREPTFSRDYSEIVDHWKREAAGHKGRVSAVERERDDALAAVVAAKAETATQVAAAEKRATERLVRAELKAHAVKAGITDVRDLALLDVSAAKLTDAGDVDGAEAMIEAFRKERPHLFGKANSSSSTATPPAQQPPVAKDARTMTPEEWREARRGLALGRRAA